MLYKGNEYSCYECSRITSYNVCYTKLLRAHLDYYFALNAKLPLLVNGDQEDLHQYLKINNERGVNKNGYDAYYITTSHYYKPISNKLKNQFDTCSDPVIIPVTKYGTKRINLFVWRLTKFRITSYNVCYTKLLRYICKKLTITLARNQKRS